LTAAERSTLEKTVVETHDAMPLLRGPVGVVSSAAGLGLGAVCVAAVWTSNVHGSGARAVIIVLSVGGLVIAAGLVFAGLRQFWRMVPRRPTVVREARTLAVAAAQVIEIPVERAWMIDVGDEDSASPLLIRTPGRRYVYINTDGLDALYDAIGEGDGQLPPMLGPTLTIERFEHHDLSVTTGPGTVAMEELDLSSDPNGGEVWLALCKLETEVETSENDLPSSLRERLERAETTRRER